MNFQVAEQNGVIIATVDGQVRISTQNDFLDFLNKLFEEYATRIVILDLEKLCYMNSAGIGIIVDTFKKFRDKGGRLILAGLSSDIFKLFEVTKLNRFIEIYLHLDDAMSKTMV